MIGVQPDGTGEVLAVRTGSVVQVRVVSETGSFKRVLGVQNAVDVDRHDRQTRKIDLPDQPRRQSSKSTSRGFAVTMKCRAATTRSTSASGVVAGSQRRAALW